MIRQRGAATGLVLAVVLVLACRDAPTAPVSSVDEIPDLALDGSGEALPGPAQIISAYTEIGFYNGLHGGQPSVEFRVGMEYIANRASMSTSYTISGDGTAQTDKIVNQKDSFYDPRLHKDWDELYYVPTSRNCGLTIDAETQHSAWWLLWLRWLPSWESTKTIRFSLGDQLKLEPCDPEAPSGGSSGGGTATSAWITVETCYYWAHYVGGVLVSTELRYCEFDAIPIADE